MYLAISFSIKTKKPATCLVFFIVFIKMSKARFDGLTIKVFPLCKRKERESREYS